MEGSADKPKEGSSTQEFEFTKSSLVGLAFSRQFTSADCNARVQAKHDTPTKYSWLTQMQAAACLAGEVC
jgi:hypothetical protein